MAAADLAEALRVLRAIAPVEAFVIPQATSLLRLGWDHIRSAVTGRVYTHYLYESKQARAALRRIMATGDIDIVHVDSLVDLTGFLPMFSAVPVIGTHHNVESRLLERRARVEGGFLRRIYIRAQSRLARRTERDIMPKVALNIAVSGPDAQELQTIAPGARLAVIPNGVDIDEFQPANQPLDGVVFVGGATWFPNRDALEHFATSILPALRRRVGDVKVTWVGRTSPEAKVLYRERHGIDLTGYVEDIRPFVHSAACYVVPLRVGGGTRLKILDAWAMGKAVVSTPVGCEGLETRDGDNILVRAEPEAFAEAVASVLSDSALRERLSTAARRTATELYAWPVIGEQMIPLYEQVCAAATDPMRGANA